MSNSESSSVVNGFLDEVNQETSGDLSMRISNLSMDSSTRMIKKIYCSYKNLLLQTVLVTL